MLFELINPSDPYTFRAPSIEVAGAAVILLSAAYGARSIGEDPELSTPVMFGWDEWAEEHGVDGAWLDAHRLEVAEALDSFLIGGPAARAGAEEALAKIPTEDRESWRARRQDSMRSSLSKIGERAYEVAKKLREERPEKATP